MKPEELMSLAREALKNAHAPFSGYRVGAALLTRAGKVFTGCNVESSSYGLTVCAERVALFKAISEGERDFEAMAVTVETGGTTPCGACRQVLWDLAPEIIVYLERDEGGLEEIPLKALFPRPFGADRL